ncbi:hypothetical protein [Methanobrevibacter sp.]|uniref:hypothetical protein n=1 Tax=Methanobrevibacter sp. TaxID=66852 RepID=UPI002E794C53|nr:hypothetical protein [Methanobrevibacter sp.]MEE1335786.1 hypothetical protein [Methanobrevibacter sp.]
MASAKTLMLLAFGFFILSLIFMYLEKGISTLTGVICACSVILMIYYYFQLKHD